MKYYLALFFFIFLGLSFKADAQEIENEVTACESNQDCESGNCVDGTCAAREDKPAPETVTEAAAPQDNSKKKEGEYCIENSECASNQCKRDPDTSTKMIMINGIFCGVHANLLDALASVQCQEALAPEGCRKIPFTIKQPDGSYVQQMHLACPKDLPAKACIKATCTNEEFFMPDFNDENKCTVIKGLDGDRRLQ